MSKKNSLLNLKHFYSVISEIKTRINTTNKTEVIEKKYTRKIDLAKIKEEIMKQIND